MRPGIDLTNLDALHPIDSTREATLNIADAAVRRNAIALAPSKPVMFSLMATTYHGHAATSRGW
jgi:hypothetical protein